MATLAQARAAARRKYGKRCDVSVRKDAPSPAERQRASDECKLWSESVKDLDSKIRDDGNYEKFLEAMCKAARFVCDTNGDGTAIEQLYGELRFCEQHLDRKADRRDAIKERDALRSKGLRYKYAVKNLNTVIPGFPMCEILHEADTLDDLMEAMAKKTHSLV